MDNLIFDLETIPRLFAAAPTFDPASVKLGQMKDQDKIDAKIEKEKEKFEVGLNKKMSTDPDLCQIILCGWIRTDEQWNMINEGVITGWDDDAYLLKQFMKVYRSHPFRLVGWNSKKFDIPVIWKRMVIQNLLQEHYFDYLAYTSKYNHTLSLDLMHVWSNYNDYYAMKKACACLGIESKTDMDGSMVYDAYKNGEYTRLKEYVMEDCENCRLIGKALRQ